MAGDTGSVASGIPTAAGCVYREIEFRFCDMIVDKMKKILFIVNPKAGKNRGLKAVLQATSLLKERGMDGDILVSEFAGHAVELAGEADQSLYSGVVAVGGDGTLFEVINGFLREGGELTVPVGQVPVGTGNSFIKDLNIHSVEDAVEKIAGGNTRKIDLGFLKHPGGEFYFINLLGTGFVADVAHRAKRFKWLGPLSYVLGVLGELARLRPVPVTLTVDGREIKKEYVFAEICNSTRTGGDMIMAPDAKIDDGFLDVVLLKKITRRKLLKIFPSLFKGTHVNDSHVETFTCKNIKIEPAVSQRLSPDGEIIGHTPIEISILPRHISMFS